MAVFTLGSLFMVEIGYRVYLSTNLASLAGIDENLEPNPTFNVYLSPPPWVFNEAYGFDYYQGNWRHVQIKEGKFAGCIDSPPRFGQFEKATERYQNADFKVLLIGSSFTMLPDQEGLYVNDLLEEFLEDETEFDIAVLNISREATGMLASFDIAVDRISDLKPDLIMMAHNQSMHGYQRHWRIYRKIKKGYRQLAYSLDPLFESVNQERIFPQPIIVSDLIDKEWCDRQSEFADRRAEDRIDSEMVDELIDVRNQVHLEQLLPLFTVDFWTLRRSFIVDFIVHRDPFHNIDWFKVRAAFGGVSYHDYGEDARFIQALNYVKGSGIPYLLLHIPILAEMRAGPEGRVIHGLTGTAEEKSRSLHASLESLTSSEFFPLYSLYPDETKSDPLSLVLSEQDNHPSSRGVHAMAAALSLVVLNFLDKEGLLLRSEEKQSVQ